MKRHAAQVRQYMSRVPLEAEQCETAGEGLSLMQYFHIHHLPVMSGSHLKGVVTRQGLLEAQADLGKDFADTPLQSVCNADVIIVSPVDPIDEVCRQLLDKGTDHALVMDAGFVVGIVTNTDVLRFITDFFGQT